MIDIIIPAYNAHKTIKKTLFSIYMQKNLENLNVYIVNDASDTDYSDEVNIFSKVMNIKELKLDKNKGSGYARQYGVDNSSSEYIVFIDSDDAFIGDDALIKMQEVIEKYDMVFAKIFFREKNSIEMHEGCLHGKMYRRSIINKFNIRFNELRSHEDNAYNQLYMLCCDNIFYLDDIVYDYINRENSITNTQDVSYSISNYIDSFTWLFNEIEKRKIDKYHEIAEVILVAIYYCYFNYLMNREKLNLIFSKMGYLKKMYKKYIKYLDNDEIVNIYKYFDYPVIPIMSVNEFINKIKLDLE